MKGEIDNDFYCSDLGIYTCEVHGCAKAACSKYLRKYPTPEQYKEKYGEEWKGATYCHCTCSECDTECEAKEWATQAPCCLYKPIIICACTPFGKPPSGWRPK
jgi:hypothetical protein